MKPDLDNYNLEELVERWKEHDITKGDLLQYGASDKLWMGLLIRAEESLIESAAVQDNYADIGNIIRQYLDSYINIRKLYSALSSSS